MGEEVSDMGRPRRTWTDAEIEQFPQLCAIFCTKSEVCSILGIDSKLLDRFISENFPDTPTWDEAFEYYSGEGRATLRRKMFELAMSGDKAALIFMAKNYLGMSDNGPVDQKAKKPKAQVVSMVGNSKWAQKRAANE